MPTFSDVSIIDTNTAKAKSVESGLERSVCSESLCGSKNLTVYRRTIRRGRQLGVDAGDDYHLIYVMQGSADGRLQFKKESHTAEDGAGAARARRIGSIRGHVRSRALAHGPRSPAGVEAGLGGPGYFFN
jgi:hypothetical protein